MVPKRFNTEQTQTTAMAMSMGHSSSAYSLLVVSPTAGVMAAATMMTFQPQKLTQSGVAEHRALHRPGASSQMPVNMPFPTKAKITAFVCRGRSRPKV